jgi:hypothetical protein
VAEPSTECFDVPSTAGKCLLRKALSADEEPQKMATWSSRAHQLSESART